MMAGEYLDDNVNVKDEDLYSTTINDELDAPLLINDSLEPALYIQPCLFGQKGYRRPSLDAQSQKAKRQLIAATTLCFIFMIAELVGGYAAGSLAIITDAAHLLSDCISFIVALIAIKLSKRPADNKMSFGYKRAEVFGAVLSVIGIWLLTAFLVYLALVRLFRGDYEIDANTMIVVSSIGVFINIIMGVVLHGSCFSLPHGHSHNGSSGHHHHHNHHHSHINNHTHNSHDGGSLNNNNQMHNGHVNNNGTAVYLSPELNGRSFNLNRTNSLSNTVNLNSLSTSRSQSRHNSFNKILNNKNLEEHRTSIDLLRTRIDEPLVHRMSIDGGLTRITVDNRSFSRVIDDATNLQLSNSQQLQQHRGSTDSTHSGSDCGQDDDQAKQNINIRAAVIHVIGDFIQSVGVFVAALVIKMNPNAKIADPICTFFFSIIVIFTTIKIMRDSINVLLDAVPSSISLSKLETELGCIQGVKSIHNLNVWGLSLDHNIMSVHLIVDHNADTDEVLQAATTIARKGFDIKHSTIQIEKIPLNSENETLTSFIPSSEDGELIL